MAGLESIWDTAQTSKLKQGKILWILKKSLTFVHDGNPYPSEVCLGNWGVNKESRASESQRGSDGFRRPPHTIVNWYFWNASDRKGYWILDDRK